MIQNDKFIFWSCFGDKKRHKMKNLLFKVVLSQYNNESYLLFLSIQNDKFTAINGKKYKN